MRYLVTTLCLMLAIRVFANDFITITTDNTCLLLKVNEKKKLEQSYFGKRTRHLDELEKVPLKDYSVYSTFGTNHVFEAALRVTHADGNTSTDLVYISSKSDRPDGNIVHTAISLKDAYYGLYVDLHYNAYQKENIIEQ